MAKTTKTTDEEVMVATQVEEEGFGREGFEEEEVRLSNLPVLAVTQSLTPEVVDGEIPGMKAGILMNSATKEPLGVSQKVRIYRLWNARVMLPPRGEGNFPICSSVDGKTGSKYGNCAGCPRKGFTQDSCRDQGYFIGALESNPSQLIRLIMWKTSRANGRKLVKILSDKSKEHNTPIYSVVVTVSAEKKKNEKKNATYWIMDVEFDSVTTDIEELKEIRPYFLEASELRERNIAEFAALVEQLKAESAESDEFGKTVEDVEEGTEVEQTDADPLM